MQEDHSELFEIEEKTDKMELRKMNFFNKDTQIIKEGQRFKVVYGEME